MPERIASAIELCLFFLGNLNVSKKTLVSRPTALSPCDGGICGLWSGASRGSGT